MTEVRSESGQKSQFRQKLFVRVNECTLVRASIFECMCNYMCVYPHAFPIYAAKVNKTARALLSGAQEAEPSSQGLQKRSGSCHCRRSPEKKGC